MHGHVGASSIVASNFIIVDVTSNYVVDSIYASKHNRQPRKKQFRPFECAITSYFRATNPYKKSNEAQQHFFENMVLYIYKGYMPLSTCDNIWLNRLVLCLCMCVVFPSCATFVK